MTNFTFFRGKKADLVGEPVLDPSEMTCKVTVKEKGKPDKVLTCPGNSLHCHGFT